MASKGEKFVIVKYALDHPNANYYDWLRFSRSQPNLRVRINDVNGYLELSLHEGQWTSVHEFTSSYKSMVLTRLKDEWNRAIDLFPQKELVTHLHLASAPVQAERVVSTNGMVNPNSLHTRESIREQITQDALKMTSQDGFVKQKSQAQIDRERAKAELKATLAHHNW